MKNIDFKIIQKIIDNEFYKDKYKNPFNYLMKLDIIEKEKIYFEMVKCICSELNMDPMEYIKNYIIYLTEEYFDKITKTLYFETFDELELEYKKREGFYLQHIRKYKIKKLLIN